MNLPLSWLKDYMNTDGIDDATYTHMLTMSGSMVEGIENPARESSGLRSILTPTSWWSARLTWERRSPFKS